MRAWKSMEGTSNPKSLHPSGIVRANSRWWKVSRILLMLGVAMLFNMETFLSSPRDRQMPLKQPETNSRMAGPNAAAAASQLARRILEEEDHHARAIAVSEAFAWAGAATRSEGRELMPAVAPSVPFPVNPIATVLMGAGAHVRRDGGYELTLADLGDVLQVAGWGAPGKIDPGQLLARVISMAVIDAVEEPSSPHSFVPLFLKEMAAMAHPPVDLASGRARPEDILLSSMEVQLLLLAHLRGYRSYEFSAPKITWRTPDRTSAIPGLLYAFTGASEPGTQGPTPCSAFQDNMYLYKHLFSVSADILSSVPIDKFYDQIPFLDEATKKGKIGRFAIGKALNVLSLVLFMKSIFISLHADPLVVHAMVADPDLIVSEPLYQKVTFEARSSGLDIIDGKNSAFFDCFSALGFPSPMRVVEQLETARVRWDVRGLHPFADMSRETQSTFNFHIPPYSAFLGKEGRNRFKAKVLKRESRAVHANGVERQATFHMEAQLDTSQMPDPSILVYAMIPTKLPDAIFPILVEVVKKAAAPKARRIVYISYHEPR